MAAPLVHSMAVRSSRHEKSKSWQVQYRYPGARSTPENEICKYCLLWHVARCCAILEFSEIASPCIFRSIIQLCILRQRGRNELGVVSISTLFCVMSLFWIGRCCAYCTRVLSFVACRPLLCHTGVLDFVIIKIIFKKYF